MNKEELELTIEQLSDIIIDEFYDEGGYDFAVEGKGKPNPILYEVISNKDENENREKSITKHTAILKRLSDGKFFKGVWTQSWDGEINDYDYDPIWKEVKQGEKMTIVYE